MNYKGKLYGKIQNYGYFDTGKTSDDYDELIEFIKEVAAWENDYSSTLIRLRARALIKRATQ